MRDIDSLGQTPGMPVRGDRIRQYVNAYCGRCHREQPDRDLAAVERLPGYLSEADGRVWLVRGCRTHGRIVTLYDEDPAILDWLERWTAPTKHHMPDTPGNFDPAPLGYARGLGELQTQHTCILLTDIVEGCNLSCPTCFTDSPTRADSAVPVEAVLANVDQRLARENGRLDVVMLSGGEPTLHPDLPRLLDELATRDIHRILINTNGVLLARDDRLIEAIQAHDQRVEVYLQFDGLRAKTQRHHRGADLSAVKQRAIKRLSEAEIFTTLTMTATLGLNDDEIGDVIEVALANDFVGGVSIQPEFGSGRGVAEGGGIDPLDRLTHTGVLARLAEQTGGVVRWQDLTALPCSHPHCASVGYMIKTDDSTWRSLISLIGPETLADHLDLVANKVTSPELARRTKTLVKQALLGLLSDQSSLSHPDIGQAFSTVCASCDLGVGGLARLAADRFGRGRQLRRLLAERVVRITVKPFMDIDTMIEPRLMQCCVHVGTRSADGADQCAPFCAVQAWSPLADQRLSLAAAPDRQALLQIGPRP